MSYLQFTQLQTFKGSDFLMTDLLSFVQQSPDLLVKPGSSNLSKMHSPKLGICGLFPLIANELILSLFACNTLSKHAI